MLLLLHGSRTDNHSVLVDFSNIKVRDCMIPRTDIIGININDTIINLRKKFIQTGHSKILVYKENLDNIPVFPGVDVCDPTGAGDSFAGGFCGYLAKFGKENLIDAIIYGSAVASFTVSQFSVDGLRNIQLKDIEKRAIVISNLLSEKISTH